MFLEMLERQNKRRISKRALGEPKHKFSAAGLEAPRFSSEAPRPEGSVFFSRRLHALEKQQHEPRKNGSKLDQNNSD
jgi:hypothetical protein